MFHPAAEPLHVLGLPRCKAVLVHVSGCQPKFRCMSVSGKPRGSHRLRWCKLTAQDALEERATRARRPTATRNDIPRSMAGSAGPYLVDDVTATTQCNELSAAHPRTPALSSQEPSIPAGLSRNMVGQGYGWDVWTPRFDMQRGLPVFFPLRPPARPPSSCRAWRRPSKNAQGNFLPPGPGSSSPSRVTQKSSARYRPVCGPPRTHMHANLRSVPCVQQERQCVCSRHMPMALRRNSKSKGPAFRLRCTNPHQILPSPVALSGGAHASVLPLPLPSFLLPQ